MFFDVFHVAVFFIYGKGGRYAVSLVQVDNIRFVTQLFQQFDASASQYDGGGYFGLRIGIVQTERRRTPQEVIFFQVCGEKEQGGGAEYLRIQIVCFYPDRGMVDIQRELDTRIGEEFIDLFLETYLHRLVGIAALVVITVLPQDADAGEVLPELVGAAHMRASQETEAAGIYLQTLIDGEFHGKISHAFFKTGVYFVRRGKRLG